jgi:hypothetical protein
VNFKTACGHVRYSGATNIQTLSFAQEALHA